MSFVLAFDYGTKSIGVAVGNEITKSATPLEAVRSAGGSVDLGRFAPFFEKWQPSYIVVGYPLNMDGTSQDLSAMAERFGRELAERYGVELHFADERLTTAEAREMIFERGGYRSLEKGRVDCVAAALILESFFARPQGAD